MCTSFTVSSSAGVPSGTYNATFVGLEKFEENIEKYGEGCLLKFRVTGGDLKGQVAGRICSRKFSTKSKLYTFAKALVGRDLITGENFDFADHVGAMGMIFVEETAGGSTRVATFLKAAE